MEFHEAANIFPLDEDGIPDLAKDIRAHGQQVPIERLDGKILDGRRRFKACELAGVEPKFRDVNPADPVAYVLSLNLHRRHLTPSQRAMVGARVRELYDRQAKERQRLSQGRGAKKGPENLPDLNGDARDLAGKAVGVSGKSIDHAKKVIENAIPEVVAAVDEGRMAVSTAAILSTEPEEVQREEAESPNRRRDYRSVSKGPMPDDSDDTDTGPTIQQRLKSKAVELAHEALNCLTRVPKNDPLRKDAFRIVTDWIRRNP